MSIVSVVEFLHQLLENQVFADKEIRAVMHIARLAAPETGVPHLVFCSAKVWAKWANPLGSG